MAFGARKRLYPSFTRAQNGLRFALRGYGSTTTGQDVGTGTSAVAIGGGSLTGLTWNTLYHFRTVATSACGTSNGADATFTTSACTIAAPANVVATATSVSSVNVTWSAVSGAASYQIPRS